MAKDEGHGFTEEKRRLPIYATILFMNEYLLK